MHPSLAELQSLLFELLDQLLCLFLDAFLRRDIYGEPRLALVMLLVLEAIFPLIQSQKDNLRRIQSRIVLRNDILLGLLKRVVANDWLNIRESTASKLGG